MNVRAMLSPTEIASLPDADLSQTTCVIFDVLRATSTMITALANGSTGIVPVAEIPEALAMAEAIPGALLAGERNGLRIGVERTGGRMFDLGNSPREFTASRVWGKTIVMTTTNGTRAIRSVGAARQTLIGSFLNLTATADWLLKNEVHDLLLVASGTGAEPALEDALGLGALMAELESRRKIAGDDAATTARLAWLAASDNLLRELGRAANARRLLNIPSLAADVEACLVRDKFALAAGCQGDGVVRQL